MVIRHRPLLCLPQSLKKFRNLLLDFQNFPLGKSFENLAYTSNFFQCQSPSNTHIGSQGHGIHQTNHFEGIKAKVSKNMMHLGLKNICTQKYIFSCITKPRSYSHILFATRLKYDIKNKSTSKFYKVMTISKIFIKT